MVKYLVILIIFICCGFVVYPLLDIDKQGYQETNAYVVGRVVDLTASRAGRVVEIGVQKGQRVAKGEVLMRLDDALIRYEIEQLKEEVKGLVIEESEFCFDEQTAAKDITRMQNQRAYLIARKERLSQLEQNKALAFEDIRELDNQISQAKIEIQRLQGLYQKASFKNRLPLAQRPRITAALASLKQKYYHLSLSEIVAPYDGFVYELTTYPGAQITTNDRLAIFIPDEELMIEANVLETHIHYFKPNSSVTIYPDVLGRGNSIKGVVHSIVPTVSADLSVLPRNNQDSNWIKVSQRIPVLIQADSSSLDGYRIPMGTSVKVEVDTKESGASTATIESTIANKKPVRLVTASDLDNLYNKAVSDIFAYTLDTKVYSQGACL